jgi:hypothetical protein
VKKGLLDTAYKTRPIYLSQDAVVAAVANMAATVHGLLSTERDGSSSAADDAAHSRSMWPYQTQRSRDER